MQQQRVRLTEAVARPGGLGWVVGVSWHVAERLEREGQRRLAGGLAGWKRLVG
jgi:hypothetical protein